MHQAASAVAMGIILWLLKSFDHLTTTAPPQVSLYVVFLFFVFFPPCSVYFVLGRGGYMCRSSHVKDRGGRAEVSSLPTMQVLGFKLESLGSVVSTFSHRVIRPALMWHFICVSVRSAAQMAWLSFLLRGTEMLSNLATATESVMMPPPTLQSSKLLLLCCKEQGPG